MIRRWQGAAFFVRSLPALVSRLRSAQEAPRAITVTIDGLTQDASASQLLIDVTNRSSAKLPQVCYYPQPGALHIIAGVMAVSAILPLLVRPPKASLI